MHSVKSVTMAALLQAGGEIVEAACVIEMPDLHGRSKLGDVPLYTQIDKEGD